MVLVRLWLGGRGGGGIFAVSIGVGFSSLKASANMVKSASVYDPEQVDNKLLSSGLPSSTTGCNSSGRTTSSMLHSSTGGWSEMGERLMGEKSAGNDDVLCGMNEP